MAIFRRAFDGRPTAEKILLRFDMSSDSFVRAAHKKPDLANNFLMHERHLFRSLQIDRAGEYLDSRPKIRRAGYGIPKNEGDCR
jgi:hypothetical protein